MDSFRDRYLAALAEDPMSAQARAQHRNVLLVGSLSILIAQLNLVPKRISALGVDLQSNDRHALRIALLIAVVYFTVVFVITAGGDALAWFALHRDARAMSATTKTNLSRLARELEVHRATMERDPDERTTAKNQYDSTLDQILDVKTRLPLYRLLVPINLARAVIDFGIPVATALAATTVLANGLG